jgi:sugar (pentulose or hexulose) kinase
LGDILAVDVGTTTFKVGIFGEDLTLKRETSRHYDVHLYDRVKADIDPELWWQALKECCLELSGELSSIAVVSLSVTTPGLVPMTASGAALGPAVLFLDGRAHQEAKEINEIVGEDFFLQQTCNVPVSGGSSLCSIMWIRKHQPDVWRHTAKFGHCNTYMVRRMTGAWAVDPSTVSITGMYNSARNDLTWNERVLALAEIPLEMLPPLVHSHSAVETLVPGVARELGLPHGVAVLCGGNDAVLAALSCGVSASGDISAVHGTCDVTCVCVEFPIRSRNFNVRCHVVPNRWLAFFVLNTGGKALEWFHSVFCRELDDEQFFGDYVPNVLGSFLERDDIDEAEKDIPTYVPYLQGSRYSFMMETAAFGNLTLNTSREQLLLALVRGNFAREDDFLKEVASLVPLKKEVVTSGGAARIGNFLRAKRRWSGHFEHRFQEQSSLRGAAMLGSMALGGRGF